MEKKNLKVDAPIETKLTTKTMEEILKENQELNKRLDELEKAKNEKPKSYEEQILFFETQQKLIKDIRAFELSKDKIVNALNIIQAEDESGELDTKSFVLNFAPYVSYGSKDPIFSLTNKVIIAKLLEGLVEEVNSRLGLLRKSLQL